MDGKARRVGSMLRGEAEIIEWESLLVFLVSDTGMGY